MFVNREAGLRELRELSKRTPALALVYGRRRVGKTYLLDHVWKSERHFYFLAADTTSDMKRNEFLRELGTWSRQEVALEDFPSWRNVFRAFVNLADRDRRRRARLVAAD